MIRCRKSGSQWVCKLLSKDGSKNLGEFKAKTKEQAFQKAKARERQVQFFKKQNN